MYKCRLTKNKFHTNKKKLINENETNQKKKLKYIINTTTVI